MNWSEYEYDLILELFCHTEFNIILSIVYIKLYQVVWPHVYKIGHNILFLLSDYVFLPTVSVKLGVWPHNTGFLMSY